jgi:hypothetical protein
VRPGEDGKRVKGERVKRKEKREKGEWSQVRTFMTFCFLGMVVCGMSLACWCTPTTFPASWFADAQRWPALTPAATAAQVVTPPEVARTRFAHWVQVTLAPEWRPADTTGVPYFPGWGFVYSHETADYHLRAREAMRPCYPGAQVLADGLVVDVHAVAMPWPLPTTSDAMLNLLKRFLNADLLQWPAGTEYEQPVFRHNAFSAFYALPNNFYAWTDGTTLRITEYVEPPFTAPTAIWARLAESPLRSVADGALNYPLDATMRDPWLILAARDWPPTAARQLQQRIKFAPAGALARFSARAKDMIVPTWLPAHFTDIPYVAKLGFVSVQANHAYRVRFRETTLDLPLPKHALLLAIQPLDGKIPVPRDTAAMMTLLRTFISPQVLDMNPLEQLPPEVMPLAGGLHFARYRSEDTAIAIPVDLFAWTDGNVLLIALVDDIPGECSTCVEE